jgi:DHA3 family tetracycline resistance protein-like MFS transporter
LHARDRLGAYPVYLITHGGLAVFLALTWGVAMIYQVEVVGLNPFQLVLVGTALELTCFLFEVPTGVIADVYSRRLSIIAGVFLLGVGFMLMGSVPAFWMLLVSQVITGVGYTCLSGAEQAWITDEIGESNAARVFVRGSQVAHAGRVAGILGAVVLGTVALQLPMIVGGALTVLLGIFLVLVMPEHGFRPTARKDRTNWQSMQSTLVAGSSLIRRRPVLLTILGIAAFFGMYNEGFDRLWTAHLLENFSLPNIGPLEPLYWWAVINVAIDVLGLLALEVVRRRLDMNSHQAVTRTLFAINVLLIGAVISFGLAGSFALAIILLIGGSVLREAIYPLQSAWLNQSLESNVRATVFSMHGQADAIGQIAGGPAIGAVGTLFSLRAALVAAGLILAPGLLLHARAHGQDDTVPTAAAESRAAAD